MLMPILRLVLIYLVLVAAVVAVFNRDRLAPLMPGARDRAAEVATPANRPDTAETSATEPDSADTAQNVTPASPGTHTEPVFPDPAAVAPRNEPAPAPTTDALQPPKPGSPAPLGTPVAAPATTEQPEPTAGPATDMLSASIAEARAAYWSGDIGGARSRMLALSEAHPDNPDVAGELGNLAFALRDYPAAAEAWARAGALLIDRGEGARVMAFLPILQSIAPDRAAALAARMQDG